jgi:hypothetical protein
MLHLLAAKVGVFVARGPLLTPLAGMNVYYIVMTRSCNMLLSAVFRHTHIYASSPQNFNNIESG